MAIKKISRDSTITVVTTFPAEQKLQPWNISDDYVDFDIYFQDLRKIVVAIRNNDQRTLEKQRRDFENWCDELTAKGVTFHGVNGQLAELCRLQEALLDGEIDAVDRVNAWAPYRKFVEAEHAAWALGFCQGIESQIARGAMSTVDYADCLTRSNFVASIQEELAYFRKRAKADGLDPEKFLEIGFAPNHEGLVQSSAVAQQARAAVGLSIS